MTVETGSLEPVDMIKVRELAVAEPARELSDREATAVASVFDELAYRRSRTHCPIDQAA